MILKKNKSPKLIKPKNVSALPAKEDFSALDSAVSDLARETEALLGKTGEKMSKPVLPKKNPSANSKAKSFDIIHNPDVNKRSEALLKAPHPGQKLLEADDETKNPSDKPIDKKIEPGVDSVAQVSAHSPGALKFTEGKTIEPDSKDKEPDNTVEVKTEVPEPKESSESDVKEVPKSVDKLSEKADKKEESSDKEADSETKDDFVVEEVSKTDNKDEEADKTEVSEETDQTDDSSKSGSKTDDPKPEDDKMDGIINLAEQGDKVESAKTDSSQKVQLFSDNLTDAKSEDEDEDGDQPEIFDTDEYHPTLHDWSKLEHHSSWPIALLLILVILFAVGVYVAISGVKIPYLS